MNIGSDKFGGPFIQTEDSFSDPTVMASDIKPYDNELSGMVLFGRKEASRVLRPGWQDRFRQQAALMWLVTRQMVAAADHGVIELWS